MSDNHGFSLPPESQKTVEQIRAFGKFAPFLKLISWIGIGGDGLKTFIRELDNIQVRTNFLVQLTFSFHAAFSEKGWIFSDSMNVETAQKALDAHLKGEPEEAEAILANEFTGENLDHIIQRMCLLKEFSLRRHQLQEASRLTREERYVAATPLLLIIADGVGSDAFKKSIFSNDVDVNEPDSFAGQPEALPKLIHKMGGMRQKTIRDDLTFPYRNGILHGRDLGYGNRIVNAKCWSLLVNIADVIQSRKTPHTPEPKPSFRELLEGIARSGEIRKALDKWEPREVIDKPLRVSAETLDQLDGAEPEATLFNLLMAWKGGNYGRMAEITLYSDQMSRNQRAGEIREHMEGLNLIDATVTKIEDKAPARSDITVELKFSRDDQEFTNSFVFNMISQNEDGDITVRGDEEAKWWANSHYQYEYWHEKRG